MPLAILQVLAQQARLRVTANGYWHRSLPGLVAGWLALAVGLWHRWCVWVTRRCPSELRRTLLSGSVGTHALLLWLGLFFAAVFHISWHLALKASSSPWSVLGSMLLVTRRSPAVAIVFGKRLTPKRIKDATELLAAAVFAAWLFWPITADVHAKHAGTFGVTNASVSLDHSLGDNTRNLPSDIKMSSLLPFVPPVSAGRVVKVYDGDTITLAAMIPCMSDEPFKFSVRLRGIDTPEMKTKDGNEREAAVIARDALASMISGKVVELSDVSTDKYGRLLADVVMPGQHTSLSEWLIQRRHAVVYDGGTKHTPSNWLKYLEGDE